MGQVAHRNGDCRSLVFAWRRQAPEPVPARPAPLFLPVEIGEAAGDAPRRVHDVLARRRWAFRLARMSWLASGRTGMREGFAGLALLAQEELKHDPHSGDLLVFRGRRFDPVKFIWHDGQAACLFCKRRERGRFIWPTVGDGAVAFSSARAFTKSCKAESWRRRP